MSQIFNNTLVQKACMNAVTFVDNHDTQPQQGLQSWVLDWFKPLAYALILLRKDGYPCIFMVIIMELKNLLYQDKIRL